MPTLKRTAYTPTDGARAEVLAKPDAPVFQIRFTGEVFDDYADYIDRLSRYRKRVWTCTRTGKTGLTYEEALVSERKAGASLETFPEALYEPILRRVHHSTPQPGAPASLLQRHALIVRTNACLCVLPHAIPGRQASWNCAFVRSKSLSMSSRVSLWPSSWTRPWTAGGTRCLRQRASRMRLDRSFRMAPSEHVATCVRASALDRQILGGGDRRDPASACRDWSVGRSRRSRARARAVRSVRSVPAVDDGRGRSVGPACCGCRRK